MIERMRHRLQQMRGANSSRVWLIGLGAILLIGALIRLTAIEWGLPNQAFNHSLFVADERSELIASLLLGQGIYEFPIIRLQPFFYYLSFIYFALYFVLSLLTGRVTSWTEYQAWQLQDLSHFILVGRLFIVFLGIVTILLTFFAGRRLFGKRVGIISAIVLLASLGHVTYSRIYRLDSIMPFMAILAFYLLLRILYGPEEKLRWYVMAGFVVAAAAATKLSGFGLVAPLLLVPFLDPESDSLWPIRKPLLSRPYVFALFVCLASYVAIAGPSHIMQVNVRYGGDIGNAPRSVMAMTSRFNRAESYRKLGGLSVYSISLPYHLTSSLPRMLSLPVHFLAAIGVVLMLFERRSRAGVLLLLFAIFSILLPLGMLQRAADRDVLPLLPLLAICAGYGIERLIRPIGGLFGAGGRFKLAAIGLGLVLVVILVVPVSNVARHTDLLTREDTRDVAARWIEANIPSGTILTFQKYGPGIIGRGSLDEVDDSQDPDGRPIYELHDLLEGTSDGRDGFDPELLWPFLDQTGAKYVMVNSLYYERFYNAATETHFPEHAAQGQAFHDYLAGELDHVQTIVPQWGRIPGPIIQIYSVPDRATDTGHAGESSFEPYRGFDRDIQAIGYGADELKWRWLPIKRWSGAEQDAGLGTK